MPPERELSVKEMLQILVQKSDDQDAFKTTTTAAIRTMETQISQIATFVNFKPPGALPSDTKDPNKEQLNAITTRSGKVVRWADKMEPVRTNNLSDRSNEVQKKTYSKANHLNKP